MSKETIPEVNSFVEECVKTHGRFLIPILQDIQSEYNYLSEDSMRIVSEKLDIPLRDVYGVASFYQAFSFTPKGKHIIIVCLGTACHVRGGAAIADALSRELNIKPGETSQDSMFTLETVNCLGCCAIGPIVVMDGEYHGQMNASKAVKLVQSIKKRCSDG
ncbi:MAG: NAD(P)H-dependent oxidoreductase subunit E [Candidatus Omnitrophica bacterium]|nr:NAD(P)H-dependent oxidoreductase subunit E [Candidatus Omnitrophota bacterium]